MILVTGAAGFIGSHLVDRLLRDGNRVLGVDNLTRGSLGNLEAAIATGACQFIQADLSDEQAVANLVEPAAREGGVHTVWHLAANSDIAAGVSDPNVDFRDTYLTTHRTLALMQRVGARRIVFASTSAVYGETEQVLSESFGPCLPISSYGAMKLASEGAISAAVETFLDQAWICRFPNVVGGRSTHGAIFDFAGKLLVRSDELEVLGNGLQTKPYLHASELIDAMLFIEANSLERRGVYNIGPEDDGASVKTIAEAVLMACGLSATIRYTGGDRGWVGDVPRVFYSVARLRELGWQPKMSSRDAIVQAAFEVTRERGLA